MPDNGSVGGLPVRRVHITPYFLNRANMYTTLLDHSLDSAAFVQIYSMFPYLDPEIVQPE